MDYRAKISLIGNEKTGKTSLILRYIKNTFTNEYITTLGADFIDKTYSHTQIDNLDTGNELTLTIWDMAGQSHFKEIAKVYCEGSAGVIIVFDVNDKTSFEAVYDWYDFIQANIPDAEILVVGNKIDLPQEVENSEIKRLEKKIDVPVRLASAKLELDNEKSHVQDVFEEMANKVFAKHQTENIKTE